jgi:preprotein translocase SecE subunit
MNLSTYLKEIQKELNLTTFPSQNVVVSFTLFVVIFTAVMAVYLGALDLGFGEVVIQGLNNFKGQVVSEIATTTSSVATSTLDLFTATSTN